MDAIFHDIISQIMEVYIDDIVVKSKKVVDNVGHLRKEFEKMRKHAIKLNPLKCAFGIRAKNFLGFLVHQRGVEVDTNKAKAIIEAKLPWNKELQRFLGQVQKKWKRKESKSLRTEWMCRLYPRVLKFDGSSTKGTASIEYEALVIGLEILKL